MSYKVEYYTLAKMAEGKTGNVKQSEGICYTDMTIDKIENAINAHLSDLGKDQVCVLTNVQLVSGYTLT
jgi:hypothetical protein